MAKVDFTAGRIAKFKCPESKGQAFLWDGAVRGLRATPGGRPAFIFQGEQSGKTIRVTIGGVDVWSIPDARARARELQRLIDLGRDPRVVAAEVVQADKAARKEAEVRTLTVGEAWNTYVQTRQSLWGVHHRRDHERLVQPGGRKAARGTDGRGVTIDGPLYPLMGMKLAELDEARVEAWAAREAKGRPTVARLAHRLLKSFLGWCQEHPDYKALVPTNAAKIIIQLARVASYEVFSIGGETVTRPSMKLV